MTNHTQAPSSADLEKCFYCGERRGTITISGWPGNSSGNCYKMCIICFTDFSIGDEEAKRYTKRSIDDGETYTLPSW